jgi:hypothetical protein
MTDEQIVERIELSIPAASPEEALARRPYERLIVRLRSLGDSGDGGEEDDGLAPGWENRVVDRWIREFGVKWNRG